MLNVAPTGKYGDLGRGATLHVTSCTFGGQPAVIKTIENNSFKDELAYHDKLVNFKNTVTVLQAERMKGRASCTRLCQFDVQC